MPRAEDYQVVARRFRPRTFDELVGQEAVVATLSGALGSGRVPHAFLFAGSRGVGKTTCARILARALNCERGVSATPCGECATCRAVLRGENPDVVEIDAASHNLVDDVRELRERVALASMGSRYKVYILDEVHMLTRNAFNAFLKTLEEPPANVVFVLATTEPHKVPETIRSRCQILLFRRIGEPDIVQRLQRIVAAEQVRVHDAVLEEIAASCRGGMRDAETTLERVLPVARETDGEFDLDAYRALVHRVGIERVIEVTEELCAGRAAAALHFADEVIASGIDEREALGELLDVLRALLLLLVDGQETALVTFVGSVRERLWTIAQGVGKDRIDAMIQVGLLGRERIRRLDDRRLVLEVTLLRMAEAGAVPTLADLVAAFDGRAPAPASEPAPAAEAAGPRAASALDLHAALLAAVRREKPMLGATLEACRVTGPDAEGTVVLELRTARKLHHDRLAAPGVREMLQRLATEVAGRPVRIRVAEGSTAAAPESPPRPAGRAPGPAARRVASRFGGQILEDAADSAGAAEGG